MLARTLDDSGEWNPWAHVPLQRVIAFGSDVAQWKLQRVADLGSSVDHSLVLAPGKWQIRIDGIDAEEDPFSYASPALDLQPGSIVLGTLAPYVTDATGE